MCSVYLSSVSSYEIMKSHCKDLVLWHWLGGQLVTISLCPGVKGCFADPQPCDSHEMSIINITHHALGKLNLVVGTLCKLLQ